MDVIIVLALLEMSLVLIIHAILAELILIVNLDIIAPKNHVLLHKVLAV